MRVEVFAKGFLQITLYGNRIAGEVCKKISFIVGSLSTYIELYETHL